MTLATHSIAPAGSKVEAHDPRASVNSTFIQDSKYEICTAASALQCKAARWKDLHTFETAEELVEACRSVARFLIAEADRIEGRFLR